MNNVFTAKLLQNLNNKKGKKGNKGFTLIELLVVVIIIGVLAAVALPNLLSQVGKARETEGKNGVGSINRAQQAYHFERREFTAANITQPDNALGVVIAPEYYDFTVTAATPATQSKVTATGVNNSGIDDGVRNYAGATAFAAGAYNLILCQADNVGAAVDAAADATSCTGTEVN